MVLKAIKNSLKKKWSEKEFLPKKKNSMKKKQIGTKKFFRYFFEVWKVSEVPKFGYFPKVM